ncbi:MAG: rhodanese-like domain-containing protein, partial [Chlorobium sp.]|uniref:rhodanese-like domain-containing protein n=1 Tax=Chlorobium sp. TaxID=1095 RepID=UPI0025C4C158
MAKIKHVTPSVAFEMTKKGALFVDVREEGEIARKAFDVPEIMAVPLSRFQSGFKKIPVNRKVILVCRSGNRSSTATNMLMSHSYKNVSNLQGGIIVSILEHNVPLVLEQNVPPLLEHSVPGIPEHNVPPTDMRICNTGNCT